MIRNDRMQAIQRAMKGKYRLVYILEGYFSKDDDESVSSIRNDGFLAMGMDTLPKQSTAAASPPVEADSEIGAHIEEGEMEHRCRLQLLTILYS